MNTVYQVETKAGDVVFFSEATVHGALPWTMPYERRLALYRFANANYAYGRAYLNGGPARRRRRRPLPPSGRASNGPWRGFEMPP